MTALLVLAALTLAPWVRTGAAGTRTADVSLGYPRLGIYGSIRGWGFPFYNAPTDSTLDPVVLDQYARYDVVVLDVSPIGPYRPDIVAELRARHPGMRIIGYVTASVIWPADDADSLHHFPTRYRHMIRNLGGFLYNSVDGTEFAYNVNLALRDAGGRCVVADSIAELFNSAVAATGLWDGIFLDTFCSDPSWLQDATHQIDYVRAGYPTLAAFLAGYRAATDTLADRLRSLVGQTPILVGNCSQGAHTSVFNGWMREAFPFQGPGTWNGNVLGDPHGYFADDRDFQQPPVNFLSTWLPDVDPGQYTADSRRKIRLGLGTASLGQGFSVAVPGETRIDIAPFFRWWYDEYAVDIVSGHAATDLAHTHWLGRPLGARYQQIWAGTNPDASTNPGVETSVSSGWHLGLFGAAAATVTLDTTTAAVGRASAHVAVTALGVNAWDVNFQTAATLPVAAGGAYTATFWARASSPRTLPVEMVLTGGGGPGGTTVALDTAWTHYQVTLQPTYSASVTLEFFLGTQTGDVWFDDVHFQQGVTSIWRRDFENGVVLVNPSGTAQQVPLGGTFRRILGTVDPVVNDGSSVTTAGVPASDALFLIGTVRDTIPPATVRDARLGP